MTDEFFPEGTYTPINQNATAPKGVMPRVGKWCLYNDEGRITATGFGHIHEVQLMAISSNTNYLFKEANQQLEYVDVATGDILKKKPCPYFLNKYTLKGIPKGAMFTVDQWHRYGPTDGTDVELEFSHEGLYNVEVDPFPYLPFTIQVVYETDA